MLRHSVLTRNQTETKHPFHVDEIIARLQPRNHKYSSRAVSAFSVIALSEMSSNNGINLPVCFWLGAQFTRLCLCGRHRRLGH